MKLIRIVIEYDDHYRYKWFLPEDIEAAREYALSFLDEGYPVRQFIDDDPTVVLVAGEFLEKYVPLSTKYQPSRRARKASEIWHLTELLKESIDD